MGRIMAWHHSLSQKDVLKFVYYFMIIFLPYIFLNIFLLLVSYSYKGVQYVSYFKFDYLLFKLILIYKFT
jgi:hypothetical protein